MGLYIVIEFLSILLFLQLAVTGQESFWLGYETGDRVSTDAGLRHLRDVKPSGYPVSNGNVPVSSRQV